MKFLQPYIYEIIRWLVKGRKDNDSFPHVATEMELFKQIRTDVNETIAEMEQDGLITHHENINGIRMFRQLKEKEDENDNVQ